MHRDEHVAYGVAEWWMTEDGNILYVEFRADMRETIVCPYDMEHDLIVDWIPLLVRHRDMTGGKAIRVLGYEPVEGVE
ncbi:MAG: hypothetical protein PUE29_10340 [Olsenella sp.]|nr:hypothetical protein [Olsenella sp.]